MNNKIKLIPVEEWKEYRIDELFIIHKGKRLIKENMSIGKLPYLGAIDNNNGVRQYIEKEALFNGKYITVNYNGSVGEAYYQSGKFWASDDVNVFELIDKELTQNIAMFLIPILKLEKKKYMYGRKWTLELMRDTIIKLPSKNNKPDFEYMEEYISNLENKYIPSIKDLKKPKINKKSKLKSIEEWRTFKISEIFYVKKGKNLIPENIINGKIKINYLSRSTSNNGIIEKKKIDPIQCNKYMFKGNCLSIGGETASVYYQDDFFLTGNNIHLLYNDQLNKYNGLFIKTILEKEERKYTYGRSFNLKNINNTFIKLPSKDSNPDWKYMEEYMQSLPYSYKI